MTLALQATNKEKLTSSNSWDKAVNINSQWLKTAGMHRQVHTLSILASNITTFIYFDFQLN